MRFEVKRGRRCREPAGEAAVLSIPADEVSLEVPGMLALRILVVVGVFGSPMVSALFGCAAGSPVTGNGIGSPAASGEEAGACFSDGTCNQGLECLDGVCVAVEEGGESEDEDEGDGESEGEGENGEGDTLLIFHNGSGPMCLEALDWLEGVRSRFPALAVEEHLTYEAGEAELLGQLEARFQTSQGVSRSFEYLPIVFFREQAFSGFNEEIAAALGELLPSASSDSP